MSEMDNLSDGPSRLFFAIWPDEQTQAELLSWQQAIVTNGKNTPKNRLHLTLAFLGQVSERVQVSLVEQAKQLQVGGFELMLDEIGYFKGPQIAWIGPHPIPTGLSQLRQELSGIIQNCGLPRPEHPFKPHVTLARKAKPPVSCNIAPLLLWRVEQFCLVRSRLTEQGPEYHIIEAFPLTGESKAP